MGNLEEQIHPKAYWSGDKTVVVQDIGENDLEAFKLRHPIMGPDHKMTFQMATADKRVTLIEDQYQDGRTDKINGITRSCLDITRNEDTGTLKCKMTYVRFDEEHKG